MRLKIHRLNSKKNGFICAPCRCTTTPTSRWRWMTWVPRLRLAAWCVTPAHQASCQCSGAWRMVWRCSGRVATKATTSTGPTTWSRAAPRQHPTPASPMWVLKMTNDNVQVLTYSTAWHHLGFKLWRSAVDSKKHLQSPRWRHIGFNQLAHSAHKPKKFLHLGSYRECSTLLPIIPL